MSKDFMNYGGLVQDALRGVVRQALARVAAQGLPGNHHLYISFKTPCEGVDLPQHLRDRYPEEMTIVLQHQYWGLHVGEDQFEVQLNFNKMPERLVIPFGAMTGFFDPSVQFGLQFQPTAPEAQPAPEADESEAVAEAAEPVVAKIARPVAFTPKSDAAKPEDAGDKPRSAPAAEEKRGQVLTLDAFRKK